MLVLGHKRQEFLDAPDLRRWRIAMPLQICAHPENTPEVQRPDVCSFCGGLLHGFAGSASPARANLKDLDALTLDPKCKIKLGSDVGRRTMLLNEGANNVVQPFCLELGECHVFPKELAGV